MAGGEIAGTASPADQQGRTTGVPAPHQRGMRGWMQRHPLWALLGVFVLAPLLTLCGLWIWLRLTTMSRIRAELNAMGLPADAKELVRWRRPKDDGAKDFRAALHLFTELVRKYGDLEFCRIAQEIKPEEYAARQEELDALYRGLEPVQAKMTEALLHEEITLASEYVAGEFGWGEQAALTGYRNYALTLIQRARYEAVQKKNPVAALQYLREGLEINRKLRGYVLIEHLVMISVDGILTRGVSDVLQQPGLRVMPLRGLGEMLLSEQTVRRETDNQQYAFVGEMAMLQDLVLAERAGNSVENRNQIDESKALWGALCRLMLGDIDYQTQYRDLQFCYSLSRKEYPDAMSRIEAFRKKMEADRSAFRLRKFLPLTNQMNLVESMQNILKNGASIRAWREEAGIACLLAADRLDGKDWPKDLSDAPFPLDPFTQKPFKLLLTPDSVLICSVGRDGKSSGKEAQYNMSGTMPFIHGSASSTRPFYGEDDIVFRLPRELYDKAAGAGAVSAPMPATPGKP